jgi:two-component system phosphate regulon sensor histidine kinase PhoR
MAAVDEQGTPSPSGLDRARLVWAGIAAWLAGPQPALGAPTERSETSLAGAAAEAQLEALYDPAVLVDARGVVVGANSKAQIVLPALRSGHPLSFAVRVPELLEGVKAVAGGGAQRTVEFVDRVPVERWTEAQISPVRSSADDGAPVQVLLQLHDLTPIKRAERMRVDFVANASHELRTPLASLLGFVETLQGPAKNDEVARGRFLEIMRIQATRMARLIEDLLSLSRIELHAHLRPNTPVELGGIVRQVADALAPLAEDRGVTIAVELPTHPTIVLGDRDELIRVVENLVENAIKYGGAGGKVDVACTVKPGDADGSPEAFIRVRDFGPGIAAEHLPRLTERFYRVDVAESREKGGTGLGLALVKHVLARHRGRLDLSSTPGEGACFTIALPLGG